MFKGYEFKNINYDQYVAKKSISAENFPSREQLANNYFEYLVLYCTPKEKFIDASSKIVALGSCFAEHLTRYLLKSGFMINEANKQSNTTKLVLFRYATDFVSTHSILDLFKWGFLNDFNLAQDLIATLENVEISDATRTITREILCAADVFIITLGLTEIFYGEHSDPHFPEEFAYLKLPKKKSASFRQSTYVENRDNLERIYTIIKENNPNAKIIFTLSPIPLYATFRDMPAVVADCASKSILRACLDDLFMKYNNTNDLFYWPSYEIVKYIFADPYDKDNRHIKLEFINDIMSAFMRAYVK